MARPSPDEIKKQLEVQEDDVYGDEAAGGSAGGSNPVDIDDARADVVGEDFDSDDNPDELGLADEIEGDDQVMTGLGDDDDDDSFGPNPYDEEE